MAPEIFKDVGVHSYYSDMWSLGCILYELATGKPPFYCDSFKELMDKIQNQETPKVEGFSDNFNDLLFKLLEKEPMCRPSWNELSQHPIWRDDPFTSLPLPDQPHFERYLKCKGVDPEHFYAQRSHPFAKKLIRESSKVEEEKQVDILRLSHNVRKNMRQNNNYSQVEDNTSDFKLKNRDVELNFGKRESLPMKDDITKPSPQKLETEEDIIEEDKVDYMEEEFKLGKVSQARPTSSKDQSERPHRRNADNDEISDRSNRDPQNDSEVDRRELIATEDIERSENLFDATKKIGNKTVEQLLIHNIDTSVKPIIGNKDIENQSELRYSLQYLSFNPWKIEDIIDTINSHNIENHLSEVYSAIAGNSPQEKIHALAYFESIIVNSNIANRLINSAFVDLFVKVLKSAKSTQIKQRL